MSFALILFTFLIQTASAAPTPPASATAPSLKRYSEQLASIRSRIVAVEQQLFETQNSQAQAKLNAKRLQILIRLRKEEREIGRRRLSELENTVQELESRREILNSKVAAQKQAVRKFLMTIDASSREPVQDITRLGDEEKLEAPRRKLLANLSNRGLRELEMLRVDLADADQLENRIQAERQQLVYLFQDLDEKENVLELNRQLQADLATKHRKERLEQLENYRRLKTYEAQVEHLMQDFDARKELERANEAERAVSKMMALGAFAQLKGKLTLPVTQGRVISSFGKAFDPRSRLYVFKKGIDIDAGRKAAVQAISAGKVAYSGTLPNYGQVTIIDHGNHYYSLCAQLGSLSKKAGDPVAAGDVIGLTDDSGTPVYFEIRARNVAVNPLQWVSNSSSLRE